MKFIEELLDILDYIHSNSVCHRDLKPNNIVLTYSVKLGNPILIDFGLAVLLNNDAEANKVNDMGQDFSTRFHEGFSNKFYQLPVMEGVKSKLDHDQRRPLLWILRNHAQSFCT